MKLLLILFFCFFLALADVLFVSPVVLLAPAVRYMANKVAVAYRAICHFIDNEVIPAYE